MNSYIHYLIQNTNLAIIDLTVQLCLEVPCSASKCEYFSAVVLDFDRDLRTKLYGGHGQSLENTESVR